MTWEQLVIPVLLLLALLVQRMRMRKRAVEEAQGNETEMVSVPVATTKRVSIRESRRPSEAPSVARSVMEEFPASRHRRPRVRLSHMQEVRRGIVLMAVLGPCRGLQPCSGSGELDRG